MRIAMSCQLAKQCGAALAPLRLLLLLFALLPRFFCNQGSFILFFKGQPTRPKGQIDYRSVLLELPHHFIFLL
jgi:hypothetical protein